MSAFRPALNARDESSENSRFIRVIRVKPAPFKYKKLPNEPILEFSIRLQTQRILTICTKPPAKTNPSLPWERRRPSRRSLGGGGSRRQSVERTPQNRQTQSSPIKASKGQNYFFRNPTVGVRPPLSVPVMQGGGMKMNLEHYQKYCSHTEGWGGEAVFLGFGFVLAQSQAAAGMLLSPKPRRNPKILAPCGCIISSNAPKPEHRTSNIELRTPKLGARLAGTLAPRCECDGHIRHPQGLTWLKISPTVSTLNLETSTVTNKFRYLRGQDFLTLPRRERRAYPSRVCKEQATKAGAKKTATRRAAPELVLAALLLSHRTLAAMLLRHALPKTNSGAAQMSQFIRHSTNY